MSPRATASDLTLLSRGVSDECKNESVETILEGFITRGPRGGLHFVRTIAPDDWVLDKLIQELARRRIAARGEGTDEHGGECDAVPHS